jgi:hypothetical protein
MSIAQIHLDIRNRMNTQWSATAVDYGDPGFDIPNESWVRLTIIDLPELRSEIGRAAYEASGFIVMGLFTRPELDNKSRDDLIDQLAAVYRGVTFSGIYADEPDPINVGVDNGWQQNNVRIDFAKFTNY